MEFEVVSGGISEKEERNDDSEGCTRDDNGGEREEIG